MNVSSGRLPALRLATVVAILALGLVAGLVVAFLGAAGPAGLPASLAGPSAGAASRFPLVLIPVAVCGAAAGLLLLYRSGRFEAAILAVPLAAGLLDFAALPTGTQSPVVLSLVATLALIGAWLVHDLSVHKRLALQPAPINAPVLAFIAISLVSYGWSSVLRDPVVTAPASFARVQVGQLVVNMALPLLALLVANRLTDMAWLRRLNWIVIGLGALAVISFLFNLPTGRLIANGARGVFPTWVGALAAGQALFNARLSRWVRLLLLVLVGLAVFYYVVRASDWLSGWVPLGLALFVVVWQRSRRLFVVCAVVVAGFLVWHPELITENIIARSQTKGDFQRLELWRANLDLVVQHPIFGVGPAGYAPYYLTYHPQDARSTHNNYFDVISQTGLVGLGAFLWLMGALGLVVVRNARRTARRRDFAEGFANATLAGLLATLAAMMLGDWVLPFAYNQTIAGFDNASFTWILLGAAVSLYLLLQKTEPKRHEDTKV